jgi:hypothetical protein
MTYGELRRILFHVEKQDMTVKELRRILFEEADDDEEIYSDDLMQMTTDKYDVIYYQIMMASGSFSEVRSYQPTSESDYLRVLDIFKKNPEEYHRVF